MEFLSGVICPAMSVDQNTEAKLVVHILTSLNFGGVEKRMEILARSSRYSGCEHCFFAIGSGGITATRIEALSKRVTCLGQSTKIPSIMAVWALFRGLSHIKPHVVHTHGAEANFHGLIAAWLAGVPIRIGEEVGIPSHSAKGRWVFRMVYRLAHRVIGISEAVTGWLVESDEVPADKAVRIYNPVDLTDSIKARPGEVPGRFRLGFVGRLEPVKSPVVLLEAVAKLRSASIPAEVWLVGDGSQREMLAALAKQLQVEQHVSFLGYQKNPAQYISQCDLYVQPSISEGFGLALVEVMACEVPVLATAVGGAPEIIEHGRTGWLLEEPSMEGLVVALKQAWKDQIQLAALGKAGRDAIITRFEPRIYMRELETLYGSILKFGGER